MKMCDSCGRVKDLSEFGVNGTRYDLLESKCKLCFVVEDKETYRDSARKRTESNMRAKEKCR